MKKTAVLGITLAIASVAQLPPGSWKTDLSRRSIDLSELKSGGPPKDGIPAIDRPRFVSPGDAAAWLDPREPVLVVEHAGVQRAYPLQILIWHELVNDQVEDLPLLVSYCPLCNSAIVFDRRIEGRIYDFGVSGMLRASDMVMYDRQTDSLWQQLTGEAIVGVMTGRKLRTFPSQTISFSAFARAFPAGQVLSRDTGYDRPYGKNPYVGYESSGGLIAPVNLPRRLRAPKERIVTVRVGERTKAYPFSLLRRRGVVEDSIGPNRYVVFFQQGMVTPLDHQTIAHSKDLGAAGVFSPELDGRRLRFRYRNGDITDKETGSKWNILGMAVDGPLVGRRLTPVEHGVFFAFAWLVFNPETTIVGEAAAEVEPVTPWAQPPRPEPPPVPEP